MHRYPISSRCICRNDTIFCTRVNRSAKPAGLIVTRLHEGIDVWRPKRVSITAMGFVFVQETCCVVRASRPDFGTVQAGQAINGKCRFIKSDIFWRSDLKIQIFSKLSLQRGIHI